MKALVSQNEALTTKLKNMAKSQYSLPKSGSNQKLDTQVPPTNPSSLSKQQPPAQAPLAERPQPGPQTSSFDRQLKSATSSQLSSHRDKENQDLNVPRQPHAYGARKPLEERPQDRYALQEYSVAATPLGSATASQQTHSIVVSSPAKQPRMGPSSSLSGLHQLEEVQREEDLLRGPPAVLFALLAGLAQLAELAALADAQQVPCGVQLAAGPDAALQLPVGAGLIN